MFSSSLKGSGLEFFVLGMNFLFDSLVLFVETKCLSQPKTIVVYISLIIFQSGVMVCVFVPQIGYLGGPNIQVQSLPSGICYFKLEVMFC